MGGEEPKAAPPGGDGEVGEGRDWALGNSCLIGLVVAMFLALVVFPVLLWTLGIACGN